MEKGIISTMVASIPESQIGEIQSDHEIWQETDGGAHLKVTRHILPMQNGDGLELLMMSVSGHPVERARVIN